MIEEHEYEDDSSDNEGEAQEDSDRNFVEYIVDNILARPPYMQVAHRMAEVYE